MTATDHPTDAPAGPAIRGKYRRRLRVVVVGAGFGGLSVVMGLRGAKVDITVVDKQNHHLFQPLLYQVATAALSPADIAAPIRTILKRQDNVHVMLDEVVAVDADARAVRLAGGDALAYDVLVLATGARHSYFGQDAWAEHAPGIKTIDDATRVRRSVLLAMERAETFRQARTAQRDEFLTFVVIGGGPTGVEMAGAIAELTRHAAAMDFRYISPNCVRIVLVEAGPRLLAALPASLALKAERALQRLGVQIRTDGRVTAIDETGVSIGDQRIEAATVVWAAGVQASAAGAWLCAATDRVGRVEVGPDLSVPGRPEIFVIGDTAAVLDRRGKPIPGIAPAAKQQGEFVARVIRRMRPGVRRRPAFRYRHFGSLATIGRHHAVIDLGWMRLSGGLGWLFWSTAHLYFLVGFRNRLLVGLTWLWNFLTFERGARLITGIDQGAVPAERAAVAVPITPIAAA
jgi:NADH dehydrogenase FAD-containing subunit